LGYLVQLQKFEGPLGLLLHLIRKEEMDIFDINVHEITRQYLEYIRLMKELDLEVAGEFVSMAATLIHIKSKMLLPQYGDDGEVIETEDPRRELVQKLLEYQRYQEASKKLYDRPLLNRDVWTTGVNFDFKAGESESEIILDENGLFSLISMYRKAMRRMKTAVHKVRAKVQSIASRILEIKDRLVVGTRITMRELISAPALQPAEAAAGAGGTAAPNEPREPRVQVLITFLSLLELGRMGFVHLFQNETYGDIHIETKQEIERNVIERVQEFEADDPEDVAKHMVDEAIEVSAVVDDQEFALEKAVNAEPQLTFTEISPAALAEINEAATDDEILAAEQELNQNDDLGKTT